MKQPPLLLRAELPQPPGINATYRAGRGTVYMTERARQWKKGAILELRAAGFRTQPAGMYWLDCLLCLYTDRLDADAPVKLTLDALKSALDIDDSWIGRLGIVKVLATRADRRLVLEATIHPVSSILEWKALSLQHLSE